MDKPNINKEVYERYVDASVALFMEYYAKVLLQDVDTGDNISDNAVAEFPNELDKRCMKMIKTECVRRKRVAIIKSATRVLRSAAVIAVAILALSSLLFMTVEAVRVPIINYFIEQKDGYWAITGQGGNDQNDDVTNSQKPFDTIDPLSEFLPQDYALVQVIGDSANQLIAIYENNAGKQVFFSTRPYDSSIQIDSEDAEFSEQCQILEHEAVLVVKNGTTRLVWIHEGVSILFTVIADELPTDDVTAIAQQVSLQFNK